MPTDFQVSDPEPAPMMMPQVSTPEPAPMMIPPTPGYGTAAAFDNSTLASPLIRSYAEPPAAAGPNPQQLKEAETAIAMAMRFQGQRDFAADVQRGVPPEQAILRHGPKMFFNSPQHYTAAVKMYRTPAFTPQIQELEPGVKAMQISPQHWQVLQKPPPVAATGKLSDVQRARLRGLDEQLKSLRAMAGDQAEIDKLEKQREALLSGSPHTSGDGPKVLKWNPNKADFGME